MKYLKEETRFSGKYSHTVLRTISMSLQTFKKKFIFFFILGFIGRALLLSNTNLIGKWADAHFKNPELFLFLLLTITSIGFIFYGAFRIMIARLGSQAASNLYDETTWRVSRFPVSFFDTTPVGRIITRFSSDYNAIFRMAGGPLGEFYYI
jgi:ABC-type multidrug transport system fused ATPase/permease subunit